MSTYIKNKDKENNSEENVVSLTQDGVMKVTLRKLNAIEKHALKEEFLLKETASAQTKYVKAQQRLNQIQLKLKAVESENVKFVQKSFEARSRIEGLESVNKSLYTQTHQLLHQINAMQQPQLQMQQQQQAMQQQMQQQQQQQQHAMQQQIAQMQQQKMSGMPMLVPQLMVNANAHQHVMQSPAMVAAAMQRPMGGAVFIPGAAGHTVMNTHSPKQNQQNTQNYQQNNNGKGNYGNTKRENSKSRNSRKKRNNFSNNRSDSMKKRGSSRTNNSRNTTNYSRRRSETNIGINMLNQNAPPVPVSADHDQKILPTHNPKKKSGRNEQFRGTRSLDLKLSNKKDEATRKRMTVSAPTLTTTTTKTMVEKETKKEEEKNIPFLPKPVAMELTRISTSEFTSDLDSCDTLQETSDITVCHPMTESLEPVLPNRTHTLEGAEDFTANTITSSVFLSNVINADEVNFDIESSNFEEDTTSSRSRSVGVTKTQPMMTEKTNPSTVEIVEDITHSSNSSLGPEIFAPRGWCDVAAGKKAKTAVMTTLKISTEAKNNKASEEFFTN